MPIYRPSELHALGHRPKKGDSQNFLIDQNIIKKICEAAHVRQGDQIVEIGPGPGALTEALLALGTEVTAIEKDEQLAKKLERLKSPHLTIHNADALKFPLEKLPPKAKIVANLPYKITTPLIQRFITKANQFSSMTIMVQKEVAERMTAAPNTKEYGSFTVFLRCYSHPKYCFTVKPRSFYPAPKVHSAVVHLPLTPFCLDLPQDAFFLMTRTAFGQKRKMMRASLKKIYPPAEIEQALETIGEKGTARPGELTLSDFAALFQLLEEDKRRLRKLYNFFP